MKILRSLFLLFLGIILVSCGGKSPEQSNAIAFWHFQSEPNQKQALGKVIAEFEKQNNCKVQLTELSWNDGKTKLLAAFNSGVAPDVVELGSDWIAQFSSGGALRDLSADGFSGEKFADFTLAPALFQSKLFALPWTTDTRVMFFNKDLLAKNGVSEPTTMEELLLACQKINNPSAGIYGFGANGGDVHRLYKKLVSFFWSYGGDIFDASGKPVINSPENIAALEMYVALAKVGLVEGQKKLDQTFIQGKLAFWISGAWLLGQIPKENPALNYGTMIIPPPSGKKSVSFAGGEYLAINSGAKNPDLAKKFLAFMADGKNALEYCKQIHEAGFPADKAFFNDPFFASVPHRATFGKQLSDAKMTPVHPKWLDIEQILENAAVETLYDKKSPKVALDDAQEKITELLK